MYGTLGLYALGGQDPDDRYAAGKDQMYDALEREPKGSDSAIRLCVCVFLWMGGEGMGGGFDLVPLGGERNRWTAMRNEAGAAFFWGGGLLTSCRGGDAVSAAIRRGAVQPQVRAAGGVHNPGLGGG